MKAHILPQVLLKGFRVDNKNNDKKGRIMILENNKFNIFKISDSYHSEDFYGDTLEKLLSSEYESPFGRIKKMIMSNSDAKIESITFTKNEIIFLSKFSTVMWRRQKLHLNKIDKFCRDTFHIHKKDPQAFAYELKNNSYFREMMYSASLKIFDSDPTLKKTIKYRIVFVFNDSNINFPMHDRYGTVNHYNHEEKDIEYPDFMLEPLNNKVMIFRFKDNFEPLEENLVKKINVIDDNIIKDIIEMYIIDNIESYIVDNTNKELVNELSKTKKRNYNIINIVNLIDVKSNSA